MSEAQTRAEARFFTIVQALASTPGVTFSKPGSRLFGSSSSGQTIMLTSTT